MRMPVWWAQKVLSISDGEGGNWGYIFSFTLDNGICCTISFSPSCCMSISFRSQLMDRLSDLSYNASAGVLSAEKPATSECHLRPPVLSYASN